MARTTSSLAAVAVVFATVSCATAQVAPEPLKTQTYDVTDLVKAPPTVGSVPAAEALGRTLAPRAAWSGSEAPMDALVRLITSTVEPAGWRNPEGGPAILVLDGTRLEIRATARAHGEIADLLQAVRRLAGVAVVVEARLFEVERTWYKESLEGWQRKGESGVPEKTIQGLEAKGRLLQKNKVTILPGQEATILSRQRAIVYEGAPTDLQGADRQRSALVGLVCKAEITVTPDRRFVRLKLTQQDTELVKLAKETVTNPVTGQPIAYEEPRFAETAAAASMKLEDGTATVLAVPQVRGSETDRVRVLVVRPVIRIEEEERAKKKN